MKNDEEQKVKISDFKREKKKKKCLVNFPVVSETLSSSVRPFIHRRRSLFFCFCFVFIIIIIIIISFCVCVCVCVVFGL